MTTQRLFVGNLPPGVTGEDLIQEFKAYGNVHNVDMKMKENLVDPEKPIIFAFVTIEADEHMIKQCIREFQNEEFRGYYLKVSVARESFLERLKREREESAQKGNRGVETSKQDETKVNLNKTPPVISSASTPAKNKIQNKSGSAKDSSSLSSSSSSSSESSADSSSSESGEESSEKQQEDEGFFMKKKRADTSLQNGKIKIETFNKEPIHCIVKNPKQNKLLEGKGKAADEKRKESLNKMKNAYSKQKNAIQQALSQVDNNISKKIIFDEDGGTNVSKDESESNAKKKKMNLFDDADPNGDTDFIPREHFDGVRGQKLMQLQSKFNLDSRFKMDSKFLEDDDEAENGLQAESKQSAVDETSDRSWQLGIIEKVIGQKISTLPDRQKKTLRNTMLRFDPTRQEHEKFIKKVEKVAEDFEKSTPAKYNENEIDEGPLVSKDQFYKVSDNLANSLNTRGDGFSLLSIFGRSDKSDVGVGDRNAEAEEKILVPSNKQPNKNNSLFNFESSDSEVEEMEIDSKVLPSTSKEDTPGGKTTKSGVWIENFFLFGKDQRFRDGIAFFKSNKDKELNGELEDYDKVKNKLRLLINKKIYKHKKNSNRTFKSGKTNFKKRK